MKFKDEQKWYLGIPGVFLVTLEVNQDSRGALYEVLHHSDLPPIAINMRQVYVVADPVRNTIRAFHKHEKLWDFFHIIKGSAIFCLECVGVVRKIILSERKPQLLIVPPSVYHGWMSLEDNTILVSIGSEEYDPDNPDEERIKWDSFDDLFIEKYNSLPFEVERK